MMPTTVSDEVNYHSDLLSYIYLQIYNHLMIDIVILLYSDIYVYKAEPESWYRKLKNFQKPSRQFRNEVQQIHRCSSSMC
jgi:hypothetical protein